MGKNELNVHENNFTMWKIWIVLYYPITIILLFLLMGELDVLMFVFCSYVFSPLWYANIYLYIFHTQHNNFFLVSLSFCLLEKNPSHPPGTLLKVSINERKSSVFSSFSFPQSNQILTILSSLLVKVTPRSCQRIAMK